MTKHLKALLTSEIAKAGKTFVRETVRGFKARREARK